jgi:hydrophobic/amphiphilic exporter-1 (mainly G- bacteria), HAE1 family
MKIWNLAIKQPIFMTMILTAGIVMGLLSYTRMPVNLFPDVEFPVVVVTTVYPGASPEEIEDQVTAKMEDELSTSSGLESIQSTSSEGVSLIILQYDLDLSVDKASQDVRDKVNLIRNSLPTGVQDPIVQTFNPTDQPILNFSIADKAGQLSPSQLRSLVEEEVQKPLERVPDVSAVEVSGGQVREIQINLNPQSMQALRIVPQQVTGALQGANINLPGGSVEDNGQELLVRTPANLQTLDDIGNIIISNRTAPIYLHDIATVVDGYEKQNQITRLNRQDAIVLAIRKTSGSNTVTVAHGVKAELDKVLAENPNLDMVITSDQSTEVEESTDGAVDDLLYAAVLAALVMLFFFRDIRNTLVTVAGLPVIMIATLFFMDLFGISLNQISLLALALVVGLVIDDGIVVRENILRWVEKGYSPRVAASLGTAEVGLPVVAIGATIVAVFLPVAFAQGIIGKFFLDFGLTVSIAMVISVFEAVTMAPMLSAYFFKKKPGSIDVELDELDHLEEKGFTISEEWEDDSHNNGWLNRVYGAMIGWTLRHKIWAILIAIVIIVASFSSVVFIEVSFLPESNQPEFTVAMNLPGGTPLKATMQEAIKIEDILLQHPSIADVVTTVGGTGAPEEATFNVSLRNDLPKSITAKTVIDDLRGPLANVPGIIFATQSGGLSGASSDISVDVVGVDGTDYNELGKEAERFAEQLAKDPNLADIDVTYRPGRPEMQINIDRQAAADLGLDVAQIAATIRLLVNGDVATTFRGEGDEADIRVQVDQGEKFGQEEILNVNLMSASGNLIPLRNVAHMNIATSPNSIARMDREPRISVNANVVGGKSVPSETETINKLLSTWQPPSGMELRLGGDAADQADALGSMVLALLLGVVFVYMVLASQFGSFIQPFLIMLAMPLAIAGAIVALLIAHRPLDMTAIIGFIMLMGLVVKNSVLLVDFANRARQKGATADEAMLIAGPVRLRPILMTSLSMILAMLPIALGLSAGGEFRQPMSIAIMGGMITSTLLTLLVVPLAYGVVVGFQDRMAARRKRRVAQREAAQLEKMRANQHEREQLAAPPVSSSAD